MKDGLDYAEIKDLIKNEFKTPSTRQPYYNALSRVDKGLTTLGGAKKLP
jgi:hypothetical protein